MAFSTVSLISQKGINNKTQDSRSDPNIAEILLDRRILNGTGIDRGDGTIQGVNHGPDQFRLMGGN